MLVGALVTAQLLFCVTSIIEFTDIFGAVFLGCSVFFGYLGFVNSMNVTYIVIWGVFSSVHGLYASIVASVMMIIDALTFSFATMITHLLICVVSLASSVVSWRIYADFENEEPRGDLLGLALIRVGALNSPLETTRLLPSDPMKMMSGAQQPGPAGMLSGLFGAFSPPDTGHLEAQGRAAANQGAAQARGGMAAAQAQGNMMAGQQQPGSTGMLSGLFGGFSAPATGELESQGTAAANQGAAQARRGMADAQGRGQAGAAAAQAQGQAGLANAQGWFANAQANAQPPQGLQYGMGSATSLPSAGSNVRVPPSRDPFLTGGYP